MSAKTARTTIAALLTFGLVAASCGGSDDTGGSDSAPVGETAVATDAPADSVGDAPDATAAEATPADTTDETAEPAASGGEMVIGRFQAFDGWDPDTAVSLSSAQTLPAVYDSLLHFGADGVSIEPGLAESWEFDAEAMTYTFQLRDNAGFPDGTPVTSADVAFSVGHWQAGAQYGASYASIVSVDTPDDLTVVFNLALPDTFLEVLLTWGIAGIFPVDYGGMSAEDFFGGSPYGAGPFSVESYTPGEEMTLVANPNYWGDGPNIERLTYREYLDPDTALVAFEDGQLDAIELLQQDRLSQLPDGTAVVISPAAATTLALPNHNAEQTGNADFRKAISLALNRDDLAAVYGGNATPAKGVMPCCLAGSTGATGDWNVQDLDAARAALAASGIENPSITITYDSALDIDRGLAEVMQAQLGEIGIDVSVEGVDTATFLDAAFSSNFDIILNGIVPISPSIGDPMVFYWITGYFFTGAPQVADLEAAVFEFLVAPDEAARAAIVQGVEDQAFDETIMIPLVSPNIGFAVADGVSGMNITPWGMYYTDSLAVSE